VLDPSETAVGTHSNALQCQRLDRLLKIGFLLGVFSIAFALFKYSENGRYQYSTSQNLRVIVDTRTGEFWSWDGNHFMPRKGQITLHHPSVFDLTQADDQAAKFRGCLDYVVTHPGSDRDCVAEQTSASQTAVENIQSDKTDSNKTDSNKKERGKNR
jgi:hypothetical protein